MEQKNHLDQTLQQQQRLTLQQLRFVKLLEMNAPELEEAVEREVEDNPALEYAGEYIPFADRPFAQPSSDFDPQALVADTEMSLFDYLSSQLELVQTSPQVRKVAEYIIGNVDNNGYLRRTPQRIADDLAIDTGEDFPMETVEKALSLIQGFDPPGVGAASLQDSLLIQLKRMHPSTVRDDAILIISNHFDALSMKHTHKIVSASKLGLDRVKEAIDLILTLNPKPGNSVAQGISVTAPPAIPDYVVENNNGNLEIFLDNRIPGLKVVESFEEAVSRMNAEAKRRKKKAGNEFIVSRFNDARDFIRILSQRQRTLMNIMAAILTLQKDYFLTEDIEQLRPMVMRDVADLTGYDLSVISRATNNKYVSLPWGDIAPMRFFFSDEKPSADLGKGVTDKELESVIRRLVEGEDKRHPLSDDALQKAMEELGYNIKRRTVAKYRDRMGIPVARLRIDRL